jgi:hypothetical protein
MRARRHRVGPGLGEGMTATDAPDGKGAALDWPMQVQCFDRVLAAGGGEAAHRRLPW